MDDLSRAIDAEIIRKMTTPDGPESIDPGSTRGMVLNNGVWIKPKDRAVYTLGKSYGGSLLMGDMMQYMDTVLRGDTEGKLPKPAPEPPEIPTRKSTEPLIGYRYWDLQYEPEGGDVYLESVTAQHRWETTVLRADKPPCHYDPHDQRWKDRDDHGYGIYVFQSAHRCVKDGIKYGDVFGRVALSGRVVRHETGARAEVATIQELVLSPDIRHPWYPNVVGKLAERYQCDVTYDFARLEA